MTILSEQQRGRVSVLLIGPISMEMTDCILMSDHLKCGGGDNYMQVIRASILQ